MNVTVVHPVSTYTGPMTFSDGTILNFVNGQAGPVDLPYADIVALDYVGSGYRIITSDAPSTAYDPNTDALVAQAVAASGSQTTVALQAAYDPRGAAAGLALIFGA